jgi:hypothetical protein
VCLKSARLGVTQRSVGVSQVSASRIRTTDRNRAEDGIISFSQLICFGLLSLATTVANLFGTGEGQRHAMPLCAEDNVNLSSVHFMRYQRGEAMGLDMGKRTA